MKRVLAFICGICLAPGQAWAEPAVDAVDRTAVPVANLDRAIAFCTGALSFAPGDGAESPGITLRLGEEIIELVQRDDRAVPSNSRSNDRWFQNLAIVVSDIDRAYAVVRRAGAADFGRAAGIARVEPECRRDPRGLFSRYRRSPARADPIPARQGGSALAA
jgi:hypothetical protein